MGSLRVGVLIGLFGCATPPCEPVDDTVTITGWFVSPTGVGDLAVVSVSSGQGWAAGSSGAAFTRDGGESWQTRSLGPVTGLHAEGNAAYVSDGDGLVRLDGSDGTPVGLTDSAVSLVAGRADLVVAAGGTRCVSTNGTIFACELGSALGATDVFVGEVGAWVATSNAISAWTGSAWTDVPVAGPVAAVAFGGNRDEPPDARGLAILDSGAVLRSTDAGGSWIPVEGAVATGIRDLAVSDGVWWAVGDAGNVFRSTNDGETWIALADGAGPLVSVDTFQDSTMPNTQLIAAGAGGDTVVYGTHVVEDTGGGWGDCP